MPQVGGLHGLLLRVDANALEAVDSEAEADIGPIWKQLQTLGLVKPTTPARTAQCPACAGPSHDVTWLGNQRLGTSQATISCPNCGVCDVPAGALNRSKIDLPAFVAAISQSAGVLSPPTEEMTGCLWRLGLIASHLRSKLAFLVLGAWRRQTAEASAVFERQKKAVLFFLTPMSAREWKADGPALRLVLSDYLRLVDSQFMFDHARLATAMRDAADDRVKVKKNVRKRGDRAANIERLIDAMIEHLVAARDYAHETNVRDGVAELLTPPTRKHLGEISGVKEWTVSKCFDDPSESAKFLNILWQTSFDLKAVQSFRRPIKN